MNKTEHNYQVAIVGGGPVGLFLACCLHQADISCVLLEKRARPITHSRSIGIHPVSLKKFREIGLADAFITQGIRVKQGLAYCNEKYIGTISFHSCPPPYPFILTLPQFKTEQLLTRHLNARDDTILHRNAKVTGIKESARAVRLHVNSNGKSQNISAQYVIGCDGKNSNIRRLAHIPFEGRIYDDTYIMGDFSDNTSLGDSAAIFLCHEGVIESFPLSGQTRRWVVKTNRYIPSVTVADLQTRIKRRINRDLSTAKNSMLSSFGVEKKFAGTMVKNRCLLAGDAAHIVSPIGGQGMNLGWLDAWDLAERLHEGLTNEERIQKLLTDYSERRLKIARKAARRAEFNMALGREAKFMLPKRLFLKTLLKKPLSALLAKLFTMHGLRSYPF